MAKEGRGAKDVGIGGWRGERRPDWEGRGGAPTGERWGGTVIGITGDLIRGGQRVVTRESTDRSRGSRAPCSLCALIRSCGRRMDCGTLWAIPLSTRHMREKMWQAVMVESLITLVAQEHHRCITRHSAHISVSASEAENSL